RNVKLPPRAYANPGTEMNVIVDVSVATIDAPIAHHGTFCPARKYCVVVFWRRPNHAPAATTATRYPAMIRRSRTCKRAQVYRGAGGKMRGAAAASPCAITPVWVSVPRPRSCAAYPASAICECRQYAEPAMRLLSYVRVLSQDRRQPALPQRPLSV